MAQQKTPRHLDKPALHSNITQSQSLLNVSELETRAKATVQDINELFTVLQDLVPKKSHRNGGLESTQHGNARGVASATDTDTARSSDDWDRPRIRRRYNSEKYPKKPWRDDNMNYVVKKTTEEKPALERTLSNERLFASDTEAELNNTVTNQHQKIQRHFSLPTYEEESATETLDETDTIHKKSRFMIFRRRHRTKPGKKKNSSWRSFFSTLSLKRRKTKKRAKNNKITQSVTSGALNEENAQTPKQHAKKKFSSPLEERTPKLMPRSSIDLVDSSGKINEIRQPGRKRQAPEPPSFTPTESPQRKNTLETKSDAVQKKLSAWYKHAVKETNSLVPKHAVRATRSCENLLTDTEIIRKRGTFSSDTDSVSGSDRHRVNKPKTRVRKTRARRNRRREERARFHSLPNVKLVTRALNEAEKKASPVPTDCNDNAKDELTDDVTPAHVTTVKRVEAKLSFGSTLDKDESDAMKVQKESTARNWLTRQCSRTTISCIRPLQLSLFYSESPSREAVYRSHSAVRRPRVANGGQGSGGNPHEFAFQIRRSSSRRRKRRSFKRGQTRLPHQSPFYVPPLTLTPRTDPAKEDCSVSKDSGLGSPDYTSDKRFATFPVMTRDHRLSKLPSESEDSGWASRDQHLANKADTGIQTDPVIVMTAVSRVRRPVLPHVIKENSQSEV